MKAIRRTLRRLRRSSAPYWSVAVVLAGITFLAVERAAPPPDPSGGWGLPTPVVMLRRPVSVGQTLRAQDLKSAMLPANAAPLRRLTSTRAAHGRVVLARLEPGDVLVEHHLAPTGVQGIAALLPPGRRAIGVPAGDTTPALRAGDLVDVLATFPAGTQIAGAADRSGTRDAMPAPTYLMAGGATVLETADRRVTVAVTPDEAARVAYATSTAQITLLLTPPGG